MPRSASTYVLHLIAAYLQQPMLGEYLTWNDEIDTYEDWFTRLPETVARLRHTTAVFKAFGGDLLRLCDSKPIYEWLDLFGYRPIILLRRDVERHFLSYAIMKATGKGYHHDTVVQQHNLSIDAQVAIWFRHHQDCLRAMLALVDPITVIYVEDLTDDPHINLRLLGFQESSGAFDDLPRRTQYLNNDPRSHLTDAAKNVLTFDPYYVM